MTIDDDQAARSDGENQETQETVGENEKRDSPSPVEAKKALTKKESEQQPQGMIKVF